MISEKVEPSQPQSLLTTRQVAALLQIQEATLEQWRWQGRGPQFIKVGRLVRYRRGDVEAFTTARAFLSTTAAAQSSGMTREKRD